MLLFCSLLFNINCVLNREPCVLRRRPHWRSHHSSLCPRGCHPWSGFTGSQSQDHWGWRPAQPGEGCCLHLYPHLCEWRLTWNHNYYCNEVSKMIAVEIQFRTGKYRTGNWFWAKTCLHHKIVPGLRKIRLHSGANVILRARGTLSTFFRRKDIADF